MDSSEDTTMLSKRTVHLWWTPYVLRCAYAKHVCKSGTCLALICQYADQRERALLAVEFLIGTRQSLQVGSLAGCVGL